MNTIPVRINEDRNLQIRGTKSRQYYHNYISYTKAGNINMKIITKICEYYTFVIMFCYFVT